MEVDTTELTPIKAQVSKVVAVATAVTITTDEELTAAVDILSQIKTAQKAVEAKKKSITDPLNQALKSARALFTPLETSISEAELIVKTEMTAYHTTVETERQKQEAALAKKVETGQMKVETAAKKLGTLPEVKSTVEGKKGEVQFRTVKKVDIFSAALLPREYLVPNETLIRKDALAGKVIPGVKVYEEKQIAAY